MKKHAFTFVFLLLAGLSITAQKPPVRHSNTLETNLRKHIEYLASDKLEGRRTGEPGAKMAADYVAKNFASLRLKPGGETANGKPSFLQPFPAKAIAAGKPAVGYNVIGILEGTDKDLKNEAIVIGAHYDHLGRGGEGSLAANSTEIHHGADDNASGVAAIIEMARAAAKEKTNKRSLIFIAFSGEEEGLFGSKYYVNNPVFPLDMTIAMINLDMVGRLKENKLTIGGIGTASEWKPLVNNLNHWLEQRQVDGPLARIGSFMPPNDMLSVADAAKLIADKLAIPVYSAGSHELMIVFVKQPIFTLSLNEDGFGPSDHSSFYGKKIPVLFFFTGAHVDYHKPSDTADKINYDGEVKVIAYITDIEKAIDQNPVRPTYTVAKSSGTPGGRSGFSVTLGTIPSYTDSADGLVIDGVRDGLPAAKAGLVGGDRIVKLAGKEVHNIQDYTNILGEMKAGEEYEIVVIRGAQSLTLKITPAKR